MAQYLIFLDAQSPSAAQVGFKLLTSGAVPASTSDSDAGRV